MKNKKEMKFLKILNSKPFIGCMIFIVLGLAMVLAGDVVVKEGSVIIDDNLDSGGILYVNATSGNVGIGTSTPSSRLEVDGQVSITGASRVRAITNTAQSIPDSTFTVVEFDIEQYDNLGEYDEVTDYKFTAQASGYYYVQAAIQFNSAAWATNDNVYLSVYKNGARYTDLARTYTWATLTKGLAVSGSTTLYLASGDYIDFRAYHNRGAATSFQLGTTRNYVSIHRLS